MSPRDFEAIMEILSDLEGGYLEPRIAEQWRIKLEHILMKHDYFKCDIAACNCGGWHKRQNA